MRLLPCRLRGHSAPPVRISYVESEHGRHCWPKAVLTCLEFSERQQPEGGWRAQGQGCVDARVIGERDGRVSCCEGAGRQERRVLVREEHHLLLAVGDHGAVEVRGYPGPRDRACPAPGRPCHLVADGGESPGVSLGQWFGPAVAEAGHAAGQRQAGLLLPGGRRGAHGRVLALLVRAGGLAGTDAPGPHRVQAFMISAAALPGFQAGRCSGWVNALAEC